MIDGLISSYPAGYDCALEGAVLLCHDAVEAHPWASGTGSCKLDRPSAYLALASALVEAGLVEPSEYDLRSASAFDFALLEAITRRPGLPGSIGRLIREYLGSLSQITSSLVPSSVLVNGTTEISTWRYDFGRLAGATAGGSGPIQPA